MAASKRRAREDKGAINFSRTTGPGPCGLDQSPPGPLEVRRKGEHGPAAEQLTTCEGHAGTPLIMFTAVLSIGLASVGFRLHAPCGENIPQARARAPVPLGPSRSGRSKAGRQETKADLWTPGLLGSTNVPPHDGDGMRDRPEGAMEGDRAARVVLAEAGMKGRRGYECRPAELVSTAPCWCLRFAS